MVLELAWNRSQGSLGGQEGELEAALLTFLKQRALCSDQSPLSAQPKLPNNRAEPTLRQNTSLMGRFGHNLTNITSKTTTFEPSNNQLWDIQVKDVSNTLRNVAFAHKCYPTTSAAVWRCCNISCARTEVFVMVWWCEVGGTNADRNSLCCYDSSPTHIRVSKTIPPPS